MSGGRVDEGWVEVDWDNLTSMNGFRRGPFGGNLKKECFVPRGYAVYEQYAPINDDCTQFRYFIDDKKFHELSSFWVQEGDFLISCSGTMGRIARVPVGAPKGVINQALLRIRLIEYAVYPNFFLKLFRSPTIQEKVLTKSGGGAIQNLAAVKVLKAIKLPLPPFAEQKQIATKLDELLAQVETLKTRLDTIPTILKRFRQSVLAAAVSGKLTEEWRNNSSTSNLSQEIKLCDQIIKDKKTISLSNKEFFPEDLLFEIPETWKWVRLCRISEVVSGVAKGSKSKEETIELPYLRVANVQRGYLNLDEIKLISVPISKAKKLYLQPGDILFNEGGDLDKLGRGWIWEGQVENCIHQNHVFRARLYNNLFEPKYLSYYGNSEGKAYFIGAGSQTVNLANINKTSLSLLPVPLPPSKEQTEIIRHVEQYFTFADQIEQRVKDAQKRVNNLTQSILAKAFRGELTADWREQNPDLISGENSAEALLAKIKAEREKLSTKTKAVKKGRKKKSARIIE